MEREIVLLIGDGPFAVSLAEKFKKNNFSIIMTTIYENRVNEINSLGYMPIYVKSLDEGGCKEIYEKTNEIITGNTLELKYIVHTARKTYYEFNPNDPPEDVRNEMRIVNGESPKVLAEYFYNLAPEFVYISSLATKGFKKDLSKHAVLSEVSPIGTKGLKQYSYTKRLGEENLYNFFKSRNNLDKLTFAHISLMFGTNFFKDMDVTAPIGKAWDEKQTANYIADKILKGKKRIFPGFQSKLSIILPSRFNCKNIRYARSLKAFGSTKRGYKNLI